MPVFEDWLNDPLSIINNIFASDPLNFDNKVQEYFQNKLKSEKNYYLIPCLNEAQIHELKPNCLVRYRCMIQDSFDPIYFSSFQNLKNKSTDQIMKMTYKYKEHLEIPEDYECCSEDLLDEANLKTKDSLEEAMQSHCGKKSVPNLEQRMTFYCVPIPGESEWVKNIYKTNSPHSVVNSIGSSSNISHRPSKRAIETASENCEADSCLSEVTNSNNNINAEEPRLMVNENTVLSSNAQMVEKCKECSKIKSTQKHTAKKTKTEENGENKMNSKSSKNLNFPLSANETGSACLVKTYENFESYKINDMVEFIGILSQEPSLAYEHDEHGDTHHRNFQISEKLMSKVSLEENKMETDEANDDETCHCEDTERRQQNLQPLSSYPPSLVPRLHCVKSYHLIHNNPFLHTEKHLELCDNKTDQDGQAGEKSYWSKQLNLFLAGLSGQSLESKVSPTVDAALIEHSKVHVLNLRQEILSCFQEMLLGDALAAEYLLMHLLSTVFMRKDVTILGKFTLNITNIPKQIIKGPNQRDENKETNVNETFANSFYRALSQFVTMSHMFRLTTDNLNKSNLIPSKDYTKNKLITGMLQLPDHFNLVLDETMLSSGELNSKGLMNFNSIKDIITWQKVNYDFNYHQQEFPTNIRVLTLSETKSILPADCTLKLNANVERFDSSIYENVVFNLIGRKDSNLINNFRNYLTVLGSLEYKLADYVQKIVEEDIVNIRKEFIGSSSNKSNATSKEKLLDIDAIHNILIVARLQSLSYGRNELSLEQWNTAKSLEFERLHNRI